MGGNVFLVHGRTDNPQSLPSGPNFGSSILVDQANLMAEMDGNA
jgi:hypothetical protein